MPPAACRMAVPSPGPSSREGTRIAVAGGHADEGRADRMRPLRLAPSHCRDGRAAAPGSI
jgi:hypothetical protein